MLFSTVKGSLNAVARIVLPGENILTISVVVVSTRSLRVPFSLYRNSNLHIVRFVPLPSVVSDEYLVVCFVLYYQQEYPSIDRTQEIA